VRRGLLNLFGNGYAINTENLRYFPTSQIPIGPAGAESRYQEPMMAVLMIDNFYNRADENRLTTVNISDLDFYGNVNMSGISNTRDQSGNLIPHSIINNDADLGAVHGRAISIGTLVEEERSSALVNIDNVNVSGFFSGIISFHLLDGSIIQNSSVRNCYKSGLEFRASVATVKNVEFSTLGGVPLELLPAGANDAGPNFDQPQRIVLEGDSHFNHMLNGGNVLSAYMDNFSLNVPNVPFITLPDFDIPSIIRYILTHIRTQRSLTTQQAMAVESNIMTEADQFVFVASQLQDPLNLDQSRNPSVFLCGNESMMNLADVDLNINGGINTTHRFLYIELAADLLPIVGIPPIPFILPHFMINAGRLVMLNLNYGRILDQNGDE
ncbi:MAG: hypothetical protein FWD86_02050, partial [Firmicutes bacterium]|nr:hypothetical protein [Bacillota bacterium]